MRKIISAEEKSKKDKRSKVIISVILGLIMLFSTAGYAFYSADSSSKKTESIDYSGLKFEQTDSGNWAFTINSYSFQTIYNPQQTENISLVLSKTFQDYANQILYFGADSKEDASISGNQQIANNLNQFIKRSNFACLNENCEQNYPVKNCSDNIIIFKKAAVGEITRAQSTDKCVTLYYTPGDDERIADAFLFRVLGIQ